jgi:hypothetical protein
MAATSFTAVATAPDGVSYVAGAGNSQNFILAIDANLGAVVAFGTDGRATVTGQPSSMLRRRDGSLVVLTSLQLSRVDTSGTETQLRQGGGTGWMMEDACGRLLIASGMNVGRVWL